MIKYISILILGLAAVWWWNFAEYRVQPGVAKLCPDNIKKSIYKMGPDKNYKILADGRLMVEVNGVWLKLKY